MGSGSLRARAHGLFIPNIIMSKYVVGIGEALWDVLPEGKKLGGAPANFAFHVSQFGLESRIISAVGDDDLGVELIQALDNKGLSHIIPLVPQPTGTVMVSLDDKGIPQYQITENVAWDNIPFTEQIQQIAQLTRAVAFGSLAQRSTTTRNTINSFLDEMPDDGGQLKIFDINLRQSFYTNEVLEQSMHRCNVLKINDEELVVVRQLFGLPEDADDEAACRLLMARYRLKILILTCGTNGSYVFADGVTSFVETPKVTVADTVGAGDSFTAGFIATLLLANTADYTAQHIRDAHQAAVRLSAYVCSCHGAMPAHK